PDYTGLATATDNAGTPTVTQSPIPGTMVGTGTTIITLTASDGTNSADCTFDVVVSDTTAPIFTCLGDQTETASATCDFTVPDYTALITATDNCGTPTVTQSPIAGTIIAVGITVITISVTDGTNTNTCTFNLSVQETTPPTAVCQDITIALDAMGMAVITPTEVDGGSFDNCGNVTTTININTFDCSNVGENEV
ncbi:HYR domain-containing protein, partial [Patiriisocius marinus]|uniref:HYR domain-containing protein n=1 Tax=Patiriisocius marinus TaxID=1397112 RepID=UPI00232AC5C3